MRRHLTLMILAITAIFALSGCFKMDADIEIHDDETVSGTMILAMDKDMMEMASDMGEGTEDSEESEEFFAPEDIPEGATVEEYEDDEYVGQKMTFDGVDISELSESTDSSDDEWTINRDGDTYTFDGNMDLTFDEEEDAAMMREVMEDADVRIAVTFPGTVTDTNGEQDGRTVVWHPKVGEANPMHAEANAGGFPVTPVIVGALVLGALAAGGVLLARRRSQPTDTDTDAA